MAINFETTTPKKLLAAFRKAIDDGHVVTWAYDSDGDFYHTPTQWKDAGWLRPSIVEGARLVMSFIGRTRAGKKTTWEEYGVYQGRFIESMTVHCHDLFTVAAATSKPTSSDAVAA